MFWNCTEYLSNLYFEWTFSNIAVLTEIFSNLDLQISFPKICQVTSGECLIIFRHKKSHKWELLFACNKVCERAWYTISLCDRIPCFWLGRLAFITMGINFCLVWIRVRLSVEPGGALWQKSQYLSALFFRNIVFIQSISGNLSFEPGTNLLKLFGLSAFCRTSWCKIGDKVKLAWYIPMWNYLQSRYVVSHCVHSVCNLE